jgi:hypothetical protein
LVVKREIRFVRSAIGLDRRAVAAKTGGAIDQQSPDLMRSHVAKRDRRPLVRLRPSFRRRIVVGIVGAHFVASSKWPPSLRREAL